jgi:hypothetical protein
VLYHAFEAKAFGYSQHEGEYRHDSEEHRVGEGIGTRGDIVVEKAFDSEYDAPDAVVQQPSWFTHLAIRTMPDVADDEVDYFLR